MRILLGYSYYSSPVDVKDTVEALVARLNKAGFNITAYPLTLNPPNFPFSWSKLDRLWKLGDKNLLQHYEQLGTTLLNYDVFLNWNGINIHPEFVTQLPTFNVFGFFDDPESSEILSKPVAPAYDLSLVGNIAAVDTYKTWGCKEARFWPAGFFATDYNPNLTEEQILYGERDIDISLLCEKKYHEGRIKRLNKYADAFPKGAYYGAGWPNGFISDAEKNELYQRTKIGPNFHNSTGPINYRTYTLPANGIMQLCDNKHHLGKIFELNKEVVGFDTVEEAIELTNYYLHHDEERRKIAAAGWKRALKDYSETSIFVLAEKYIDELRAPKNNAVSTITIHTALNDQRKKTFWKRMLYILKNKLFKEHYS